MLKIPVLFRDFVDIVPPDQDGGGVDEDVEPAEQLHDAIEQCTVAGEVTDVHADRQMRSAGKLGDDGARSLLVKVDGGDLGAGLGKGKRHFATDAPGGPGDHDAFAFQTGTDRPAHFAPSRLRMDYS